MFAGEGERGENQGKKGDKTPIYALITVGVLAIAVFLILIAIIVIAVLFYIGVMNPRNVTPTTCTFPPGISCSSFKLNTDGSLYLVIGQALGHPMRVTGVACTQASIPQNWTATDVSIRQGESASLGTFTCTTASGAVASGSQGETAKFKIWINYTETDTGMHRQVMGDITGRYEGEGYGGTPIPIETTPIPAETPVFANVTVTEVVDSNCTECFNVSIVTSQLETAGDQLGLRVAAKSRVDVNSSAGMALVGRYNITKVPTILLSREAQQTRLMEVWNQSGTVESDGTLVLREVYPPYIDLTNGSLMGQVKLIFLLAPNCGTCYDPVIHEAVLTRRYDVVVFNETNLTYASAEGAALVRKYNITAVPTVLISPELSVYPGMEDLWLSGLGSKESDGWYVFRNMSAFGSNTTYFDLAANRTATTGG